MGHPVDDHGDDSRRFIVDLDFHAQRRCLGVARGSHAAKDQDSENRLHAPSLMLLINPMTFDPTWLFLSLIPGGVGFVLLVYGKKEQRWPHLVAGLLLHGVSVFHHQPGMAGRHGHGYRIAPLVCGSAGVVSATRIVL